MGLGVWIELISTIEASAEGAGKYGFFMKDGGFMGSLDNLEGIRFAHGLSLLKRQIVFSIRTAPGHRVSS